MEGLVLEKLYLYEKPFKFIDELYWCFIDMRLSEHWQDIVAQMKKWIQPDN